MDNNQLMQLFMMQQMANQNNQGSPNGPNGGNNANNSNSNWNPVTYGLLGSMFPNGFNSNAMLGYSLGNLGKSIYQQGRDRQNDGMYQGQKVSPPDGFNGKKMSDRNAFTNQYIKQNFGSASTSGNMPQFAPDEDSIGY